MKIIKLKDNFRLGVMNLYDIFNHSENGLKDYENLIKGDEVIISDEIFELINSLPENYKEAIEIKDYDD